MSSPLHSRRTVRSSVVQPKTTITGPAVFWGLVAVTGVALAAVVAFCGAILLASLLVYELWDLGHFLIG